MGNLLTKAMGKVLTKPVGKVLDICRRRKAEIREHFDGEITIKFNGRYLKYREIIEPEPAAREKVKRPVDEPRKRKGKYIPPPDHPWRRHNPSLHHNSYLERVI